MTIGEMIRNRRKELDKTQDDIARAVGVTKATVSRWESGDIHKMKRIMIRALWPVSFSWIRCFSSRGKKFCSRMSRKSSTPTVRPMS